MSIDSSSIGSSLSSNSETSSSDDYVDHNKGDSNYGDMVDGRYILIKKIGYGTFSTIWLTYLLDSHKYFAMKIFHADEECEHEGINEIKQIRSLAKMEFKMAKLHEVLKFTPLNTDGTSICLVLDILSCNIKLLSRFEEKIPENVILHIIREVSKSLLTLHDNGYMYTDLRPENIMVKTNNNRIDFICEEFSKINFDEYYSTLCSNIIMGKNYVLTNKKHKKKFNLQKRTLSQQYVIELMDKISTLAQDIDHDYVINEQTEIYLIDFATMAKLSDKSTNFYVQSRNYTSPEILVQLPYDYKIDIWSLGCVMYELFAGDYMIEPQKTRSYGEDENHLYWIIELLGNFPKYMTKTKIGRNYFFATGKFKVKITNKDWDISQSMKCDNGSISDDGLNIIKSMIKIDPKERPTYINIIKAIDDIL